MSTEPDDQRPSPEDERAAAATMRAAILSVLACGACFAIAGLALFGARAGLGAAIGGAIATANLWVFAQLGRAFVARKGRTAPWSVVALLKLLALFGGVWLILASGIVSPLSLAVGYAALPVGITLASLFGPRPPEPENEGGTTPSARPGADVIKGPRPGRKG
jgi:hypothetical protein